MNSIDESFPVKYAIAWAAIKRYQSVPNDNDTTNIQDGTIKKKRVALHLRCRTFRCHRAREREEKKVVPLEENPVNFDLTCTLRYKNTQFGLFIMTCDFLNF